VWYAIYEINRASLEPLRLAMRAGARIYDHPFNPVAYTPLGRSCSLACDAFARLIGTPRGAESELDGPRISAQRGKRGATILPFVRPHRAAS
jgi:poly(3-hydroxybutyrate) depolymerase